MEFRQLRHFLAVYEGGSYANAARELDLTQQAISASVAKLEDSLGATLFDRDKMGARPTGAADRLVTYARSLLQDSVRAMDEINAYATGFAGEVRVGVALMPEKGAMSRAIQKFQRTREDVVLHLRSGLLADLQTQLEEGALDFLIGVPREYNAQNPKIRLEDLFDNTVRVACSRSHPFVEKENITFEDLSHASWILPPPGSVYRDYLFRSLTNNGVSPPTSFLYSDSFTVGADVLDLGDHLVISHEGMMQPFFDAGIFKMLPIELDALPVKACIAYRAGAVTSEPAKVLIELIQDEIALNKAI